MAWKSRVKNNWNRKKRQEERKISMEKTSMASPINVYVNKLKCLFAGDPQVSVRLEAKEDGRYTAKVCVDDDVKYQALSRVLRKSVTFGNLTLNIVAVPANDPQESAGVIYQRAFEGNEAFGRVEDVQVGPDGSSMASVFFKPRVGWYYCDDISTPDGYRPILFEDLAREVMELDDVLFNTEHISG